MTAQEAIARLQAIGYSLSVKGESILCSYGGPGEPDPDQVLPLMAALREHKAEALRLLRVADLLKRGVQQPEALRDVASCPSVALLQQQGGIPPSPVAPPPPTSGVTLALSLQDDGTCYCCRGSRWWLSRYGALICATCHPPAEDGLVDRWLSGEEAAGLARA